MHPQPGIFVSQLNAFAHPEIDVDVGGVGDRLVAVEKRHIAEIDFPVEWPRRAWIVGVVRRTALG